MVGAVTLRLQMDWTDWIGLESNKKVQSFTSQSGVVLNNREMS